MAEGNSSYPGVAGKVALVTAAGSGIGGATAEAFAAAGARVLLSDISAESGEKRAEALAKAGADVEFVAADATDEAAVAGLVAATVRRFGRLDIGANIVGGSDLRAVIRDLHTVPLEAWETTQRVSLTSTFLAMKHELAWFLENGGGTIVNVASVAGLNTVLDVGGAYGSAKAGVVMLTRHAARHYAASNIRVNAIAPGVTMTPQFHREDPAEQQRLLDVLTAEQVIRRAADPSEQANGILWLCSDHAAMVTGHILAIDGGWTAA